MRFLPIPEKDDTTSTLMSFGLLLLIIVAGLLNRLNHLVHGRLSSVFNWIIDRLVDKQRRKR